MCSVHSCTNLRRPRNLPPPAFGLIRGALLVGQDRRHLFVTPCTGILEQSIGARNRVGKGLPYRPARLHRLAESIPGLLKSLKIPSLATPLYTPPPNITVLVQLFNDDLLRLRLFLLSYNQLAKKSFETFVSTTKISTHCQACLTYSPKRPR
jgi:hypothetical protein